MLSIFSCHIEFQNLELCSKDWKVFFSFEQINYTLLNNFIEVQTQSCSHLLNIFRYFFCKNRNAELA